MRAERAPGAHVLGLLLHPYDLRAVGIVRERGAQLLMRYGIELFETDNVRIVPSGFLAMLAQLVIDLAAAEQNARSAIRLAVIHDHPTEAPGGHVGETRNG